MKDDTRLRVKCAALSFASDHGPLADAIKGNNDAQEALADKLLSKLRQVGLTVLKEKG